MGKYTLKILNLINICCLLNQILTIYFIYKSSKELFFLIITYKLLYYENVKYSKKIYILKRIK